MEDVSFLQQMPDKLCIGGRRQRPLYLILYEHALQHALCEAHCPAFICGQMAVLGACPSAPVDEEKRALRSVEIDTGIVCGIDFRKILTRTLP